MVNDSLLSGGVDVVEIEVPDPRRVSEYYVAPIDVCGDRPGRIAGHVEQVCRVWFARGPVHAVGRCGVRWPILAFGRTGPYDGIDHPPIVRANVQWAVVVDVVEVWLHVGHCEAARTERDEVVVRIGFIELITPNARAVQSAIVDVPARRSRLDRKRSVDIAVISWIRNDERTHLVAVPVSELVGSVDGFGANSLDLDPVCSAVVPDDLPRIEQRVVACSYLGELKDEITGAIASQGGRRDPEPVRGNGRKRQDDPVAASWGRKIRVRAEEHPARAVGIVDRKLCRKPECRIVRCLCTGVARQHLDVVDRLEALRPPVRDPFAVGGSSVGGAAP